MEGVVFPANVAGLMHLWSKGSLIDRWEACLRTLVIDKNECLACMQIESSYVRLVVRQVAWYYGLNVMSRFETSIIKGPEYNGGKEVKIKTILISRPDHYVPVTKALSEWRTEWNLRIGTGRSVKKPEELVFQVQDVVLPLQRDQMTVMSNHVIPKDVLCYMFSFLPRLSDIACARRVCKHWNESANRGFLYQAHMNRHYDRWTRWKASKSKSDIEEKQEIEEFRLFLKKNPQFCYCRLVPYGHHVHNWTNKDGFKLERPMLPKEWKEEKK